jgi:hypothetical protein
MDNVDFESFREKLDERIKDLHCRKVKAMNKRLKKVRKLLPLAELRASLNKKLIGHYQ